MSVDANVAYSSAKEQNYTMIQAFEWYSKGGGAHWKKLASKVPELASLGITAMWIPPPTKAAGQESVGYDTYDLYDLGEFAQKGGIPTKYGTKEELVEMVKKAKEAGIVTYVDAVLNHKFGADKTETFGVIEVDNNDRTKEISDLYNITGWTGFEFPGRGNKYSEFKWSFNHFTGVDFDENTKKKAIFRIQGNGKYWASGVDNENQNYDYLMGADIDHSHPKAREDIINWGKWIINEIGAAGFRFDAVKHIDSGFIAEFIKSVRQNTDKPKMFAVGEFWKDSLEDLEAYLGSLGTQFSVFDAPLHYNFKEAGDRANGYDLRAIWDGTVVQKRPIDAVTLVDNHDTQIGQALESWVSPVFKPLAYAMILLRPDGYPCVFWGDLYGTEGPEGNPQQPVSQLGDLIRARKLFAYGELRDYWDHMNCVGWVRMGDEMNGRDGCAVVLCNGDEEGTKRMEVGKEHAGEKWTDLLGWCQGEAVIGEDGWAEFKCSARSVSVWIRECAKGREEFEKH
ncbi:glucan -alpha-maltohexaosidase precursor [Moniliophthora roreri MCA 2997]|uniref:Glucan-alpha-maltohexaosidase n=1 Tax=Moniliophthora roreri (strain MCA 2997) TaxID=1381753 RepID=V2XJ92_MONRO|nr:glucan -alpha-maltohexaosidase precursor [Moniliophthora roreri MCA 2997]